MPEKFEALFVNHDSFYENQDMYATCCMTYGGGCISVEMERNDRVWYRISYGSDGDEMDNHGTYWDDLSCCLSLFLSTPTGLDSRKAVPRSRLQVWDNAGIQELAQIWSFCQNTVHRVPDERVYVWLFRLVIDAISLFECTKPCSVVTILKLLLNNSIQTLCPNYTQNPVHNYMQTLSFATSKPTFFAIPKTLLLAIR